MLRFSHFFCCCFLALAIETTPAYSESYTGNDVIDQCLSKEVDLTNLCFGFIIGAIKGIRFGGSVVIATSGVTDPKQGADFLDDVLKFCLPSASTDVQIASVVVHYIRNNPSNRHLDAAVLSYLAMTAAFPCE